MARCAYCDAPLAPGPPWAPGHEHRLAYDPKKGRLWDVCSRCSRWNLTPLEDRWESLQACEEAVAERGRLVLSTPHLSLVDVGEGELIRVGSAQRLEFVDWRYGPRLPPGAPKPGFWVRLLAGLPSAPVEGYDPYRGIFGVVDRAPWIASPFMEAASALTYLFSQMPLAPVCPSCGRPLALRPWNFQHLRLLESGAARVVLTTCALCKTEVQVPLVQARPSLRLGLSLVTPPAILRSSADPAAREIESLGGPVALLEELSASGPTLGELDARFRAGLIIALDELAEAEALDAEWQQAEELAGIMDGGLTDVPGFEAFRREILDPDG